MKKVLIQKYVKHCVQNGATDITGYKDNENPTPMERAYCNSIYKIQDNLTIFLYIP